MTVTTGNPCNLIYRSLLFAISRFTATISRCYAWPLLLDSRRHHAATAGGGRREGQPFWLYRPAPAFRIDNDSFAGTPLPPEEADRPRTLLPVRSLIISSSLRPALSRSKFSTRSRKSSAGSPRKINTRKNTRRFPWPSVGSPNPKFSKPLPACTVSSGILPGAVREGPAWTKNPNTGIPVVRKLCRGPTRVKLTSTESRRLSL